MEGIKPACPICGGSRYYKESGFFYCVECQTQSQEIREEILEEHHYQGAHIKAGRRDTLIARKARLKDKEASWTTWEMYNFVLKGMVDELIGLGAKPSLKIVVLQLWARYLQKLEVAFTSKRNQKLPRLGLRFHEKDAKLIYGAKTRAKKRKSEGGSRKKSDIAELSSPETSHVGSHKKALFQSEYDKQCALSAIDSTSLYEQGLKNLDTSAGTSDTCSAVSSKRSQILLSSAASGIHKKISLKTRSKKCAKKIKENRRSRSILSYHRIIDSHNLYCLTRQKLPALLYLALLLNGDPIQLSDILRWIREGELSFHEVTHFFPDDLHLKGMDRAIFDKSHTNLSYSCVRKTSCGLAHLLNVNSLPAPDWLALVTRYITELELPAQLVKYIERLIVVSCPSSEFNAFSKMLPNYEGRAMAFIIVILKMLMGLDGKTESKISKTAFLLNRLLEEDGVQLFVWDDWVKHIEFRKSVLAEYHFPTQYSLDRDGFYNPENFIKFWTTMKTKDRFREERIVQSRETKMSENWVWAIKHPLLKLTEASCDEEVLSFAASLTPNKTNFDSVKRVYSIVDILQQDFSLASVDFMFRPKLYAEKAAQKGVKLIIKSCSAQKHYKKVKEIHQKRNKKAASLQMWVVSAIEESAPERLMTGRKCDGIRYKKKRKQDDIKETVSGVNVYKEIQKGNNFGAHNSIKGKGRNGDTSVIKWKKSEKNNHSLGGKSKQHKPDVLHELQDDNVGEYNVTKTLKLYLPHTHYWILEMSYINTFDDFRGQVLTKLPTSFQWLLSECARSLEMSTQDLYSEVLLVEKMHHFVLRPSSSKQGSKLKRKISNINKEWET